MEDTTPPTTEQPTSTDAPVTTEPVTSGGEEDSGDEHEEDPGDADPCGLALADAVLAEFPGYGVPEVVRCEGGWAIVEDAESPGDTWVLLHDAGGRWEFVAGYPTSECPVDFARMGAPMWVGETGSRAPHCADLLKSAPVPSLCEHDPGVLVDGELPGIAHGRVTLLDEFVVFGDIDGNGILDAVAVFLCNQGGVAWPHVIVSYTNVAAEPQVLSVYDTAEATGGSRAGVTSVSFTDGQLRVESAGRRALDLDCCPSGVVHIILEWDGYDLSPTQAVWPVLPTDVTFAGFGGVELGMSRSELEDLGLSTTDAGDCLVFAGYDDAELEPAPPYVTLHAASDRVIAVTPYSSGGYARYQTHVGGITDGTLLVVPLDEVFSGHTIETVQAADPLYNYDEIALVLGPDDTAIAIGLHNDSNGSLAAVRWITVGTRDHALPHSGTCQSLPQSITTTPTVPTGSPLGHRCRTEEPGLGREDAFEFSTTCLFLAWELGDRALAARVAEPPAVDYLFAADGPTEWAFERCSQSARTNVSLGFSCLVRTTLQGQRVYFETTFMAYDDVVVVQSAHEVNP